MKKRNYDVVLDSEKLIDQLEVSKEADDIEISAQVKAMRDQIRKEKVAGVNAYKSEIVRLIEKEIIGRNYHQTGQIVHGLSNEPEIDEAVAIIQDQVRYKKILAVKNN